MATLALVNDFLAGAVLNPTFWNDNLYDATVPGKNGSFEIINGHLDSGNMDATWAKVLPEQVQRGSYADAGFVAGTANLDYFDEWFRDIDTSTNSPTSAFETRPLPIPGANATFHVPYDAMVILTWTVFWTNISVDPNEQTRLHLYLNDVRQTAQRRDVRQTSSGSTVYLRDHDGRLKNRFWTGHQSVELSKGYHTAGLRIVAGAGVEQSRVWARSFRYIILKKYQTWG